MPKRPAENANGEENVNNRPHTRRARTNGNANAPGANAAPVVAPANANANANAAPQQLALVPYADPVAAAHAAQAGDANAYAMIISKPDIRSSLTHFEGADAFSKGLRMYARISNPEMREAILQQEIVSNSTNNSYLELLHLLEDVENLRYIPPSSQVAIREKIGIFIPKDTPEREKRIQETLTLLNKEQAAGDLCTASLMNIIPFLLAAYGEIKHAVSVNKFSESLDAISKNVKNVFLSYTLFYHNYLEKKKQNDTYNTELGIIQTKIVGMSKSPAPRFPARHSLTGGVSSQIEANIGEADTFNGFIFGMRSKIKLSDKLPEFYSLINFLILMFPDIAFECYMIIPDPNNLKNIPLLYAQYFEKALAKAKEYFTADVTVRPGRIVAVEGEWKEEENVAEQPCSKEKMMSSLSELAGDPAKDMIRNIAEKIFSFGCSILDRVAPAPAPAAAAPPPLAEAEVAPVDASGIAVAVAADAHEIVVAEPAAAAAAPGEEEAAANALLGLFEEAPVPVPNANANANANLSGGYRAKKSRKTKTRTQTRRRVTRNRKKNQRKTRNRFRSKFM